MLARPVTTGDEESWLHHAGSKGSRTWLPMLAHQFQTPPSSSKSDNWSNLSALANDYELCRSFRSVKTIILYTTPRTETLTLSWSQIFISCLQFGTIYLVTSRTCDDLNTFRSVNYYDTLDSRRLLVDVARNPGFKSHLPYGYMWHIWRHLGK